jgi:AbrB family looped-hinge helix DNA binding protein
MPAATLTEKGQIVIPAEIRQQFQLTPGTQLEFVHDDGTIRLVVRRRVAPSDPEQGYGLIKVGARSGRKRVRRLSDFDPAALVAVHRKRR